MRTLLLGFMGSGKSTIGRHLAEVQQCPLFEMDKMIVDRCGWDSIATFVEKEGAAAFRELERTVAESLRTEQAGIISSGGGVVEFPETMRALLGDATRSVYLSCSFEEILRRIGQGAERNSRPYFRSEAELALLYQKRLPLYAQYAELTVETSGKLPQEIAQEISRSFSTS